MTLEVRPFNCSNGDNLVLTRLGDDVTLNKFDKSTGKLSPVASKRYSRMDIYSKSSPVKDIWREGCDADGRVIRSSKIPVHIAEGEREGYFKIMDGTFKVEGTLPTKYLRGDGYRVINHTKLADVWNEEVTVNLKSIGNLARSYFNNIAKFFAKVR
jgi:hypothetical protein